MNTLAFFPTFFETPKGIAVLGFFFWFWMICDCFKRIHPVNEKIFWLLFICFVPPVGALVYFFVCVLRVRA
jgi:hypothetical protein